MVGSPAEDLKALNKAANSEAWTNVDAQIYLPISNSLSNSETTSTYVGYKGQTYKDLVINSPAQSEYYSISSLSGSIGSISKIVLNKTISKLAGKAQVSSAFGVATTLKSLFDSVYKSYPTTTQASTQVSSVENKTRKYAYVIGSTGDFSCRAICDSGWQYFRYLNIFPGGTEKFSNESVFDYRGPSWFNLDEKAYAYRYGGGIEVWKEVVYGFKLNNYQYFASITL